jgi:hypothetical protein
MSWNPGPYELLLERVTDGGLTIRALRGTPWDDVAMGDGVSDPEAEGQWAPAPWCYGSAELRVGVAGPGLIDVTSIAWYRELHSDAMVTASYVGWADGQPVGVLSVQVPDGVSEVVATSAGVTDRAAPGNGLAVLALPGVDPSVDGYRVDVTDPSGTRSLTQDELVFDTPEWRAACEPPPPALPGPGEQPADPAAAEAEVRDVFARLFDPALPFDDKAHLLDDATGVAVAAAGAREGDFADAAASAVHTIEDFVFTSPTEAWFRYGIDTSVGYFGQRYGRAHLIDGAWRIERAVMCQDLALAASPCDPDVAQIMPPSVGLVEPPAPSPATGEVID